MNFTTDYIVCQCKSESMTITDKAPTKLSENFGHKFFLKISPLLNAQSKKTNKQRYQRIKMWVIIFPRNSSYFISILLFSAVTVGIFYDALKNSHGAQVIELAALNVYYFPLFQTFLNNIKTCGKLLRSFADDLAENLPVLLKMQGTCKILCVFGNQFLLSG